MSETETNATTDTASQEDGQDVATQAETEAAKADEVTDADVKADTSEEAKGEETKGDEADQKKGDEDKADAKSEVPEKYEFTMPEGVELDQEMAAAFEPVAKDLGLTQEQADKMVGLYAEKILPHLQNQQVEQWAQTTAEWAEDAKADKELGGDKFDENMGVAKTALDKLATPEFKAFLNESGLGNHPEMLRIFYRIGKQVSDDAFHTANGQGGEVDRAARMYPTMAKQG